MQQLATTELPHPTEIENKRPGGVSGIRTSWTGQIVCEMSSCCCVQRREEHILDACEDVLTPRWKLIVNTLHYLATEVARLHIPTSNKAFPVPRETLTGELAVRLGHTCDFASSRRIFMNFTIGSRLVAAISLMSFSNRPGCVQRCSSIAELRCSIIDMPMVFQYTISRRSKVSLLQRG